MTKGRRSNPTMMVALGIEVAVYRMQGACERERGGLDNK